MRYNTGVFLLRLHCNEHSIKHETQTLDFTKTLLDLVQSKRDLH